MVMHHLHLRKRIHILKEKFPHPDPLKRFLDKIVYLIAFVSPLATLPQIYKVWIEQNVAGISLLSWGFYCLIAIPMVIYGMVHKEKPLIVMYIFNFIVNFAVLSGTLWHS